MQKSEARPGRRPVRQANNDRTLTTETPIPPEFDNPEFRAFDRLLAGVAKRYHAGTSKLDKDLVDRDLSEAARRLRERGDGANATGIEEQAKLDGDARRLLRAVVSEALEANELVTLPIRLELQAEDWHGLARYALENGTPFPEAAATLLELGLRVARDGHA